jgi:DNA repair exonuclease SbcCD ATPase subunit
MGSEPRADDWRALTEEVLTGMAAWQRAHPQASFTELEAAVEERLAKLRAHMLAEAAVRRAGTVPADAACPMCEQPLTGRGRRQRVLTIAGNQAVRLEREYGLCPTCGVGLFPPG